jgi:hypothetical protein
MAWVRSITISHPQGASDKARACIGSLWNFGAAERRCFVMIFLNE